MMKFTFKWLFQNITIDYLINVYQNDKMYYLALLDKDGNIINGFTGDEEFCTKGVLSLLKGFFVKPTEIEVTYTSPEITGFNNFAVLLAEI